MKNLKVKQVIKTKKSNNGITLIALIITIIVLLILAGVSIAMLTGENGLIQKAQNAAEKNANAEVEEQIKLSYLEYQAEKVYNKNADLKSLVENNLEKTYGTDKVNITKMGKNIKIDVIGKNVTYTLRHDGTVRENAKNEKMEVTEKLYGYLDESSETLYLRATPKSGYSELTKNVSYNSFIISDNYNKDKISTIVIEEPIAPQNGTRMFYKCDKLQEIQKIHNIHTENMTSMSYMFRECKSLKTLNLGQFDTSKVNDMGCMFSYCNSITEIDTSNFNTNKVGIMESMFAACGNLHQIDVSNFNTSNVTNMYNMFAGCSNLKSLDLEEFDTTQVNNMSCMFYGCKLLKKLDLKNFDTGKVTNTYYMFRQCENLEELDVGSFSTNMINNAEQMFSYNPKLKKLNLGRLFIINDISIFKNMLVGASTDIKVIAIQETSNKIINDTSLTIDNFEIIN